MRKLQPINPSATDRRPRNELRTHEARGPAAVSACIPKGRERKPPGIENLRKKGDRHRLNQSRAYDTVMAWHWYCFASTFFNGLDRP